MVAWVQITEDSPDIQVTWARMLKKVRVEGPKGCWFIGKSRSYPTVHVGGKKARAHRVSYVANKGYLPAGSYACHECDNKNCVNPSHIFAGTHDDNMKDAAKKGLIKAAMVGPVNRGENNGRSILSMDDVRAIRNVSKWYGYASELSKRYGVSRSTIFQIRANKIWQEL